MTRSRRPPASGRRGEPSQYPRTRCSTEPACYPMRIWFDMTAPAHPVVFRPIIARLQAAGHDGSVTARDYAQTLPLLDRLGIAHTTIGRHGGASRVRKVGALASRSARMIAYGHQGRFDL